MDVVSTRRVYNGKVVSLRVDTLRGKNGKTHDAEVVEHAEAVVVIVRPQPHEQHLAGSRPHDHDNGLRMLDDLRVVRLSAGTAQRVDAQADDLSVVDAP